MGPVFFPTRARHGYHAVTHETPCVCFAFSFARRALRVRGGPWPTVHTVYLLADDPRDGPVPGEPADQRPHLPGSDRPQAGRRVFHGPARRRFRGADSRICSRRPRRRTGKPADRRAKDEDAMPDKPVPAATREQAVAIPPQRRRSAAAKAPFFWWTPNRAKWSGPCSIPPRTSRPKDLDRTPPTL